MLLEENFSCLLLAHKQQMGQDLPNHPKLFSARIGWKLKQSEVQHNQPVFLRWEVFQISPFKDSGDFLGDGLEILRAPYFMSVCLSL